MERAVQPTNRIDEVTFETCPLFATCGNGVWSRLVNGVLAGTGALNFRTTLCPVGRLQQRGFFGCFQTRWSRLGSRYRLRLAFMVEECRTRASPESELKAGIQPDVPTPDPGPIGRTAPEPAA